MALFDAQKEFELLKTKTLAQIEKTFPFTGHRQELALLNVYTGEKAKIGDIRGQKSAKLRGRTWSTPIYADLELREKGTGKVINSAKKVKLANLPMLTGRASFIVEGNEYQVLKQWRLKSGVYSRIKDNGELESQFNLAKGRGFKVEFFPQTRKYNIKYGTTNAALYPVLKALGASSEDIQKEWGPAITSANKKFNESRELGKLYKAMKGKPPEDDTEAAHGIRETFAETKLRGDTTALTLGKPIEKVDSAALLLSSKKLLNISRGTEKPDERDALHFKELLSLEDHLPERIVNSSRRILRKVHNNIDRKKKVREILSTDIFNVPIASLFTGGTGLVERPNQTNPVDIWAGDRKTTVMGQGGISSFHAVGIGAKVIDPSHLAYLDPIPTPEGEKTGIVTYLPSGVVKKGRQAYAKMYNPKTKKIEEIPPEVAVNKVVAFPDQYIWEKGKPPRPINKDIKVSAKGNDVAMAKAKDVDYILPSSRALFAINTSMIPFLQNDQGGRANYAAKHISQAIGLKDSEQPLVQVHTGSPKTDVTFEKVVGMMAAHYANRSGKVTSIGKDYIKIRGEDGKLFEQQIYDNYPLNDGRSAIHSKVKVKVGDEIKKGELIADTTFTDNGVLALGKNLRVAYIPFKALNYEDGVVISEEAAKKLTSEHLYQERLYADRGVTLNRSKFRSYFPTVLSDKQSKKLDSDGVVKIGETIGPGDVLVAALKKVDPTREQLILRGIHKSLIRPFKDYSLKWEKNTTGVVEEVVRNGREIKVHIRTEEPAQVGDKLSGRHGNKGVISAILPTEEMPVTKDGDPIEVLLNPTGVGGRINPGQLLESALGKVAKKEGSPYAVLNFESDRSRRIVKVKGHWKSVKTSKGSKQVYIAPYEYERGYNDIVEDALKEAGLTDKEPLYDPTTGEALRVAGEESNVFVGYQYLLKLEHMATKKLSARGQGYGNAYDADAVPKSGGKHGAMSMGELGLYALLAHGTGPVHNLREMFTVKADREQDDFWTALQAGEPLPAPRPSFAYHKFVAYLNSLGVDVEKRGHELHLLPMSDEDVKKKSSGELKRPSRVVRAKDLRPEKGGLFDEEITGGPGGSKWSHFKSPEPFPNPLFENAIKGLLGLTGKEFNGLISGEHGADKDGKMVDGDGAVYGGGYALKKMLDRINVEEDLEELVAESKTARLSKLDKINKKIKYLRALKKADMTASEAYLRNLVPVLPPKFRPIGVLESGDLNVDDVNEIYKGLALLTEKLREFDPGLPQEYKSPIREEIYDAMKSLAGLDGRMNVGGAKGILDIVAGPQPKYGYFQTKLLKRRQDLTMRAVITPDKSLGLDQVGLPKSAAMTLFRPLVVRALNRYGYTPLEAKDQVQEKTSTAWKALEQVVKERPIMLKRDPALHKFSVMAFRPKLVEGSTIKIHPLITGGYNADFDGDAMSVYVPVTNEAVKEAYEMLPSKNLFNPASGMAMYQPTLEGQLGLFMITEWGKKGNKKYSDTNALLKAAKKKEVGYDEVVTLNGKKTTAGRMLVDSVLPSKMQGGKLTSNPDYVLDKKNLQELMHKLATDHPGKFPEVMDKFKEIGFGHSYTAGWTVGLSDLRALKKVRSAAVNKAEKAISSAKSRGVSGKALEKVLVGAYDKAANEMTTEAMKELKKTNNKFFKMSQAGIKPEWSQMKQLVLGPGLLEDARGDVVPVPVLRSYGEGLDVSDYWTAAHGARKGVISKVQEVSEPGALSKKITNTVLDLTVTSDDCKTARGVSLDASSGDALDRFTASSVKVRGTTVPSGTLITPEIQSAFKEAKIGKVHVRSALRCEAADGMCSKCYGTFKTGKPPDLRTNLGVLSGQAMGERSVQLPMKAFHHGGVRGGTKQMTQVDRLQQILLMPQVLKGKATLADLDGSVSKVSKDPAGGWRINIGDTEHYVPQGRELLIRSGSKLSKGDPISTGPVDPRELLERTNVSTVQNYLTNEMEKVYSGLGLRRRNFEVVVKAMTNLARVTNPGDHPQYVRGDLIPVAKAKSWNRKNNSKDQVTMQPLLKGLSSLPHDLREDWATRMNYSRLKDVLIQGASKGYVSNLHGTSPIPGLVYSAEFGKPPADKPEAY